MKKFLLLAAILAALFAGCDDLLDTNKDDDVNSDFFGVWTANYGTGNTGVLSLDIASNKTWTLAFTDPNGSKDLYNGTWSGSGNSITLDRYSGTGSATLSDGKLLLNQSFSTYGGRPVTSTLTKSGSSGGALGSTTLKIKNESSKTIADVLWNNVSFKDDSSGGNTDILGTWAGSYDATTEHTAGDIEFEIGPYSGGYSYDGTWSLLYKDSDGSRGATSGILTRNGINISIYGSGGTSYSNGTASLSGNKLIIRISNNPSAIDLKNRAGDVYELTKTGEPFKSGTNVTKDVEAGTGYIFFKVGTTAYRTKDLVVVEKDNGAEFTFNDYTLVVSVISPDSQAVTLGGL